MRSVFLPAALCLMLALPACSRGGAPAYASVEKCREGLKRLAARTKDSRLAEVLKGVSRGRTKQQAANDADYCSELQERYIALQAHCRSGSGKGGECRERLANYEAILSGEAQAVEPAVREQFRALLTFDQKQRGQQEAVLEKAKAAAFPAVCEAAGAERLPGLSNAQAKRTAEKFLRLVMNYTVDKARPQFAEAREMVGAEYRPVFDEHFMHAELRLIEQAQRSERFQGDGREIEPVRHGSCLAVLISGRQDRQLGGGSIPQKRKLVRVVVRAPGGGAGEGAAAYGEIEGVDVESLPDGR